MKFIKYFILLLLIIKIDCSPYNHLDTQLALLILSADNHKGKIVGDYSNKNNPDYLKIVVGKDKEQEITMTIVDIIPSLKEVKNNKSLTLMDRTKEIERRFRQLYKHAENIYLRKFNHPYTGDNNNVGEAINLYNNQSNNNIDENDEGIINDLDIFRRLTGFYRENNGVITENNDKAKLVNDQTNNEKTMMFQKILEVVFMMYTIKIIKCL